MGRRCACLASLGATILVAAPATGTAGSACAATRPDAFGPFGRGSPPVRASIGKGHVLTGVVLTSVGCRPIPGARVELWQANAKGQYLRALSGTVNVDRSGRFRFEGPYPASYEGRPPHIHLRVVGRGHEVLLSRYEPSRGSRRGAIRLVLVPAAV
jgi:protocatechuate 3,4-dioxygenase beta subunit